MRVQRRISLCFSVVALFGSAVWAQAPGTGAQNVVDIPEFSLRTPPFRTLEPSSDGTTFRIGFAGQAGSVPFSLMEGWCLMAVKPEGGELPKHLLKAQIVEIDSPSSAKIKIDKAGGAMLKQGTVFVMVRPPGVTTAQMKALPGLIPIVGASDAKAAPGMLSSIEIARLAANRAQSTNNLKQMGLALHNYYSVHSQFPPAVLYGPDGKPWHSWRVLILPFLEQSQLYDAYNFSEPWDSPKNLKVLEKMPAVYRDPVHGDTKGTHTHYAALVGPSEPGSNGPRTVMQPSSVRPGPTDPSKGNQLRDPKGVDMRNILDGTSNTVMLTSVSPERKIPWTKPEDIVVDKNFPGMGKPGGIATPYPAGNSATGPKAAPFLFADGSVRMLNDQLPATALKALITRDGGEIVNLDQSQRGNASGGMPRAKGLRLTLDGAKSRITIE